MNDALIEKLGSAGLDIEDALRRLMGDLSLYLGIVDRFLRESGGEMELILFLAAEDRREEARQAVHRLRGSAASIGALSLAEKLKSLEELLVRLTEEGGELPDDAFADASRDFGRLMDVLESLDLKEAFPGAGSSDNSSTEPDEPSAGAIPEEELERLRVYLDLQQPFDARGLLEELIPRSNGPLRALLDRISLSVKEYRFNDALGVLDRFLEGSS